MLMNTGNKLVYSDEGLLSTIAWGMDGEVVYALEGSVFMAGATIQWLRDNLGIIKDAAETELLAESVDSSYGVYFVPAFQGLGSPYWNMNAKAAITGITRGTKKEHIVRAALESIAFRINDIIITMQNNTEIKLKDMKVDGGASSNNFLLQFQANISNLSIIRSKNTESTAMGAAFAAGLAAGFWENCQELKSIKEDDRIFSPDMRRSDREKQYEEWIKAVNRVLMDV